MQQLDVRNRVFCSARRIIHFNSRSAHNHLGLLSNELTHFADFDVFQLVVGKQNFKIYQDSSLIVGVEHKVSTEHKLGTELRNKSAMFVLRYALSAPNIPNWLTRRCTIFVLKTFYTAYHCICIYSI